MNKKLLLLVCSLVTMLGGATLLAAPAHAEPDVSGAGCTKYEGCVTYKNCYSGWSSTGDPVRICDCTYVCG